ncbi:MAG: pyridoxal-phosphate dependent enzyme [Planctomycetes bacterium]|nr:pyridoxal-phosphate dependent enzyme [Planctomycetota bacterium]
MVQVRQPVLNEIRAAAERIKEAVINAPLLPLGPTDGDATILLKAEILQAVGSFKIRGVFNAVASMSPETRRRGLSTVSAGNTAQALAWTGRYFDVSSRSIMPDNAPASKIEAVRAYGGEPVLVPTDEVFRYLREHGWENEPYAFIHPWINRDLIIGHGTMGLEIIAECPDVDTIFVPVGGGGLIAGVGSAVKALKPSIRVIAVEPLGCPSLHASLEAGRPVSVECDTICDGVAVPHITEEMFPLLRDLVDDAVLVSDDAVKASMRRLAFDNKMVAEPSGALALAAALAIGHEKRGLSVCIVTGGSIDPRKLVAILGDVQRVET